MKNQYFGDRYDFFKYDLVLTLLEEIPELRRFTFIPMLTEGDGSKDGGRIKYDGSRRPDLDEFLKSRIRESKRDIRELRSFFQSIGVEYCPYRDDEFFTHEGRGMYFAGIRSSLLSEAVVVVDPDNGFEVKSMNRGNGHKYFKYGELKGLYDRMDAKSLLLAYQYIPRVQRKPYFARIGARIRSCTGSGRVVCISDNKVVFFIISKSDELMDEAWRVVKERYPGENGFLACWCGDDFGM